MNAIEKKVREYQQWFYELPEPLNFVIRDVYDTEFANAAWIQMNELGYVNIEEFKHDHPMQVVILKSAVVNQLTNERMIYAGSPLGAIKVDLSNQPGPIEKIVIDHPFAS